MHTRRELMLGAGAALAISNPALALEECPAQGMPPETCSAMLDPDRFLGIGVPALQKESQWCWAACIEMICRWHGVALSQESIVERVYGGLVNWPGDDRVLTSSLNSDWVSDDGTPFTIRANVFSSALDLADVSNQLVIDDLRNEQPLLVGARSHATVAARVDYINDAAGLQIGRVHVIDPLPGAAQPPFFARILDPDEMTPVESGGSLRYLASIRIS